MSSSPRDRSKDRAEIQQTEVPPTSWLAKVHPYFKDPERVVVLKLDVLLLTWAFIAGLLKDMDQSATTQAYVSGMKESLSLYGNELVEFTTYFSIGYALFIVPAQMIQTRVRPSIFLPVCEIIWGALTLVTYKAPDAKSIYALRFFLGVFESTSWPGLVSLIFNWYTPKELGKRLAIFGVSGVAGNMFLGILQAALYRNLNGVNGLEGWQWLFIVSGIITMVWGAVGFLLIPDSPKITRALYLSSVERDLARSRLNEVGVTSSELIPFQRLVAKLRLLVKSPLTYLFLAAYLQFAWSQRANSYFLLYLKGVTDSSGQPLYSTYTVNLIPLGGYGISIVCNIGLNALSDWKGWRWQVSCGAAALQLVATSVLSGWPSSHPAIMTFYFLTFATSAWGYALVAWLAEILRKEPEARSITVAIAVTLTYVGHATIPLRAWRVADSPRYPIGFPLSAAFCVGSIAMILGIRFYVNKYPDILDWGLDREAGRDAAVEESSDFDQPGRK
ncbi:major facilitator superfamily domain-containing protein [Durotheca rogersii]|uniref:major facilitator superfamily domain-containing protein n=1 Tax=Durotheca rogersii TaxID=419775 RepID=UPI00221F5B5C|nr:major facilitator superfamily domain-containing protein [Durotheca rogersii]KAI5859988.1 major facilitator superfamily domain-containing protein [Durotheca rogersii]